MDKVEINCHIHNKEQLRIVAALNEWQCYLKGPHHQIQICTGFTISII